MQYKTVTVEHYLRIPKKNCAVLGDKYQNIINECAADGWKLLGIHTLPIVEKAGCVKISHFFHNRLYVTLWVPVMPVLHS